MLTDSPYTHTPYTATCAVFFRAEIREDTILKIKYDKKLLVAVGKSRMAKHWQNR